jgi:serine/threonine-protein kinase
MAQQTRDRLLAGRYRVVERIGTGGMATVYLAEDERLGRRVAVKRLHADSPDDMARRFQREAKLLASLSHPNIVAVYDTVAAEDGVLIVMEYVGGETLRAALQRGPLGPERTARVVEGVAAALDHAHARGVVHRDVKPANVLLGPNGTVKLADLGIATAAGRTQITASGTVLGTPSYMAPEQLTGGRVSAAVDVYALGAIAFEALSGRKARDGRTPMEIAHRVATEGPPDLRAAWPGAPAATVQVLKRAMAADPGERYASAGELAAALRPALDSTATLPLGPLPAARRRRRFAPWLALAAFALAVALVLALSGGDDDTAGDRQGAAPPAAQRDSAREPRRSEPRDETAPRVAGVAEGRRLNDQGFALMQQGRYGEAVDVLRRAVAAFPRGTDDVHYAYALFNLGRSLRLAGRPEEAMPILEQRLQIPNQTDAVERELELARAAASGSEAPAGEDRKNGKDKKGKNGKKRG